MVRKHVAHHLALTSSVLQCPSALVELCEAEEGERSQMIALLQKEEVMDYEEYSEEMD